MGGVPEINKVEVRGGDGRRRVEGKRNIFLYHRSEDSAPHCLFFLHPCGPEDSFPSVLCTWIIIIILIIITLSKKLDFFFMEHVASDGVGHVSEKLPPEAFSQAEVVSALEQRSPVGTGRR